jgi:hypothetical protein
MEDLQELSSALASLAQRVLSTDQTSPLVLAKLLLLDVDKPAF